MPLFTLNKVVKCPHSVKSLSNILIDDDFSYITLYEGIRVQGKINIKFDYEDELELSSHQDTLDVDIMCPNEQISDIRGILLKISDYSYQINDDEIKFVFKCVLEGKEPIKEVFDYNEKNSFLEIEVPQTELILSKTRSYLTKEEAESLEALLENDNVEVITNIEENCENTTINLEEKMTDGIEVFDSKKDAREDIEEKEEINDEIKEEKSLREEEASAFYNQEKVNKGLIKDESVTIVSSYYRVTNNDTDETIMQKCNISFDELRSLNIKEGQLIKIKK